MQLNVSTANPGDDDVARWAASFGRLPKSNRLLVARAALEAARQGAEAAQ